MCNKPSAKENHDLAGSPVFQQIAADQQFLAGKSGVYRLKNRMSGQNPQADEADAAGRGLQGEIAVVQAGAGKPAWSGCCGHPEKGPGQGGADQLIVQPQHRIVLVGDAQVRAVHIKGGGVGLACKTLGLGIPCRRTLGCRSAAGKCADHTRCRKQEQGLNCGAPGVHDQLKRVLAPAH